MKNAPFHFARALTEAQMADCSVHPGVPPSSAGFGGKIQIQYAIRTGRFMCG